MVDLEAAGGAATGGLFASTFEKPTGEKGEHRNACADCGTETIGKFCHNCGNPSHVHRTLLHLGEELLHGVMHFDSRTWRTLPLLAFRPGRLTREWCQGKRTRYVSPLAMFLFTIFVLFMAISYAPASQQTLVEARAEAAKDLSDQLEDLAEARAEAAAAPPEAKAGWAKSVRGFEVGVAAARKEVARLAQIRSEEDWAEQIKSKKEGDGFNINIGDRKPDEKTLGKVEARRKDASERIAEGGKLPSTGSKKLDEKLQHKLENPELALYKLQQSFYKFSFLLIPISIPFVALLFLWKRGFTLYDHGVFVLYSLTFMSILIMVTAVCHRIGGPTATVAYVLTPFIIPMHMYYQLQGAYGLRTFSTLWRTCFLLVFCLVALACFLLATLWLSLA